MKNIKDRSKFLSDIVYYLPSTYIGQVFILIGSLVSKRFLGPYFVGIWSLLNILLSYLLFTNLGVSDAASRNIPILYGKNELAAISKTKNQMYVFGQISAFISSFIIIIIDIFIRHHISHEIFIGLIIIAIILPIHRAIESYLVLLRAYSNFRISSLFTVIYNIINAIITIVLTYLFSIWGMFISAILYRVIFLIYIKDKLKKDKLYHIDYDFNFIGLKELIFTGIHLSVYSLLFLYLKSFDSIIVAKLLGTNILGIYSIAVLVNLYIYSTPNTISQIIYPKLLIKFGKEDKIEKLEEYLKNPSIVLSYFILPILIGICYIFIKPIIVTYLPQFLSSIIIVRLLLIGTFFISLTHMPCQFLITINKQKMLINLILFSSIIFTISGYFILSKFKSIIIATLITSTAYLLTLFMTYYYSWLQIKGKFISLIRFCQIIVPVFIIFPGLWLIDNYLITTINLKIYVPFIQLFVYLLLCFPLFYYAQKKTSILTKIISIIR